MRWYHSNTKLYHVDFWLGRWATRWTGPDGKPKSGSNVILDLEGRIRELFEGPSAGGRYVGVSVSTRSPSEDSWEQEYWDNTGYHAFFAGGWDRESNRERFILDLVRGGGSNPGARRLVWHSIEPNGLLWDYELSEDGGKSWSSTWRIKYIRQPG